MTARILICIPMRNRGAIARECTTTVYAGIADGDCLSVDDDGSDEPGMPYDADLMATRFIRSPVCVGIEAMRRAHFMFSHRMADKFTHLYLTDADALHDPNWRSEALRLQEKHGGAPVCLYNTEAHARLIGNTIEDDPASDVIWRRVAPGISYLLTAEHVAKVVAALPAMPEHWSWDWSVPALLGGRFAVARQSFVDHIGYGGYHNPPDAGYDGGDRATNPTPWLVAKRAEVVAKLKAQCPPIS